MPEFRSLSDLVAPVQVEAASSAPASIDAPPSLGQLDTVTEMALSEARFFRAHLREAVQSAIDELLGDVASDVVARELQLRPVDVGRIVSRAVADYRLKAPVRARVHPDEAVQLEDAAIEVVPDSRLKRGDAFLELRDGAVDLSLGVRLERLLRSRKK